MGPGAKPDWGGREDIFGQTHLILADICHGSNTFGGVGVSIMDTMPCTRRGSRLRADQFGG